MSTEYKFNKRAIKNFEANDQTSFVNYFTKRLISRDERLAEDMQEAEGVKQLMESKKTLSFFNIVDLLIKELEEADGSNRLIDIWCAKYLNKAAFNRFSTANRVAKSTAKNADKSTNTIRLSSSAFSALQQTGVTNTPATELNKQELYSLIVELGTYTLRSAIARETLTTENISSAKDLFESTINSMLKAVDELSTTSRTQVKNSSAITVTQTKEGYSVKFPFELKDSFKDVFKTAEWDGESKAWNIGPRSGKRLEEWVELSSDAAEEIQRAKAEIDAASLSEKEIESLNIQLDKAKSELSDAQSELQNLTSSIDLLDAKKEELEKVSKAAEAIKVANQCQQDILLSKFKNACDLARVHELHDIMRRSYNKHGDSKNKFRAAASELEEIAEKLSDCGIESEGINTLAFMNHNRPDRDKPSEVTTKDILTLTEC